MCFTALSLVQHACEMCGNARSRGCDGAKWARTARSGADCDAACSADAQLQRVGQAFCFEPIHHPKARSTKQPHLHRHAPWLGKAPILDRGPVERLDSGPCGKTPDCLYL